jgi:hypothetical protein
MEPRRRRLGRPGVQRLEGPAPSTDGELDAVAAWRGIRPPRPEHDSRAGRAEYAAKWRALCWAAVEAGWSPADVAEEGVAGLAAARAAAGHEPWAYGTVAYYTALTRFAGLTADHLPRPDPVGGPPVTRPEAQQLWQPAEPDHHRRLAAWRSAAVARVAWGWPAPIDGWLTLPLEAVTVRGRNLRVDGTAVPGAAAAWRRWTDGREVAGIGGALALVTTETSRTGRVAGAPLSRRGFQAAWTRHARACDLPVAYDRYRLAAVMHGAPALGRGAVRAARRQPVVEP